MPIISIADSIDQQDAVKKLEQAFSKTNIFDLPAFQMKAAAQIEMQGKLVDGTYQLLWRGPDEWKEEIEFPGYREIQVGSKGKVWMQRNTDFVPYRIHQLHSALGFGADVTGRGSLVRLTLKPSSTIKKIRSRKEHGDKLTCSEVVDDLKASFEICVNDSTGAPFRDAPYEEKDFQPVGTKIFPRFLAYLEQDSMVARVTVNELTANPQFAPDAFSPPAGIQPKDGCINPVPPILTKRVTPVYPEDARQHHVQGTVGIDVWIGTDGVPKINKVVANPNPALAKSSLDAVSGWRYQPASCGGQAVTVETVLTVNYSLER